METTQVVLRLISKNSSYTDEHGDVISGQKILDQMKKNGVFKNDKEGVYVPVLFDGKSFNFREGKIIQVDKTVANALRRSAHIIVGPKAMSSPMCPFIEIVKEFAVGEQAIRPQFACPICDKDCDNPAKLTRHMMKDHKEETSKPAVDWDGDNEPVAAGVAESD